MTRILEWFTPAAATRLLVISYFIAVSLDLIHGTRVLDFMHPLLPEDLAIALMRGVVLTLSVLILTGVARRMAALVLSLIVFFSSYAALYSGGDISAFWRDLALVGALLMTAGPRVPQMPEEGQSVSDTAKHASPSSEGPGDTPAKPLEDQPFRDDFDFVRSG